MNYTKEQLTELVNALPMSVEANLKFVLTKLIQKAPEQLIDSPLRVGDLIVFKAANNNDRSNIQPGDMVQGYFGKDFISGTYQGGDVSDQNNFLITQIVN